MRYFAARVHRAPVAFVRANSSFPARLRRIHPHISPHIAYYEVVKSVVPVLHAARRARLSA